VREAIGAIYTNTPEAVITGIGICSPGPLDPQLVWCSIRRTCPALAQRFPLAEETEKLLEFPRGVDNDGNAAGLAEGSLGRGRGLSQTCFTPLSERGSGRESSS